MKATSTILLLALLFGSLLVSMNAETTWKRIVKRHIRQEDGEESEETFDINEPEIDANGAPTDGSADVQHDDVPADQECEAIIAQCREVAAQFDAEHADVTKNLGNEFCDVLEQLDTLCDHIMEAGGDCMNDCTQTQCSTDQVASLDAWFGCIGSCQDKCKGEMPEAVNNPEGVLNGSVPLDGGDHNEDGSEEHDGEEDGSEEHDGEEDGSEEHDGEENGSEEHDGEENGSEEHDGEEDGSEEHDGEEDGSEEHDGEENGSEEHDGNETHEDGEDEEEPIEDGEEHNDDENSTEEDHHDDENATEEDHHDDENATEEDHHDDENATEEDHHDDENATEEDHHDDENATEEDHHDDENATEEDHHDNETVVVEEEPTLRKSESGSTEESQGKRKKHHGKNREDGLIKKIIIVKYLRCGDSGSTENGTGGGKRKKHHPKDHPKDVPKQ